MPFKKPFTHNPQPPVPTPTYTSEYCYRCSAASHGALLCDECSKDHPATTATPEWNKMVMEEPALAVRVLFHDSRQRREKGEQE
jgi:hypothetical protein